MKIGKRKLQKEKVTFDERKSNKPPSLLFIFDKKI